MAERARKIPLQFYVSQEEMAVISEKMKLLGASWKAQLKNAIDGYIALSSDFEDMLKHMEADGFSIKRAKYHSYKMPNADEKTRFTGGPSLRPEYTDERIRERIAGFVKAPKRKTQHQRPADGRINLLIDIENSIKAQQGVGYSTKRRTTESIQEALETVKEMKACSREEVATTVLTGIGLYSSGSLHLLYFLGFLFAAVRLYDPISLILQNIAATFNAMLQVKRMRAIMEEPIQTGSEEAAVPGYDIAFEHVNFSYHEGEGVLKDVSAAQCASFINRLPDGFER